MVLNEWVILFCAALIGSAAVVPYSLRLAKGKPMRFSIPVLFLLSVVQSAVFFGVVIWLGLLAAHMLGHGAPYLEAMLQGTPAPVEAALLLALASGLVAGAVLLIADMFFEPYWPQALRDSALQTTLLENLLASIYGGINEELLMRLFGISALVWLLSFAVAAPLANFWIANIVTTVLFGLGHLPALRQLLGSLPQRMVVRSLLLNAPIGLLCGWLFWKYGIEAAMISHFSADIVYHVFGTVVLRRMIR